MFWWLSDMYSVTILSENYQNTETNADSKEVSLSKTCSDKNTIDISNFRRSLVGGTESDITVKQDRPLDERNEFQPA